MAPACTIHSSPESTQLAGNVEAIQASHFAALYAVEEKNGRLTGRVDTKQVEVTVGGVPPQNEVGDVPCCNANGAAEIPFWY